MVKKIFKKFISLSICVITFSSIIPFGLITCSCSFSKKYGENWICSIDQNVMFQYRDIKENDWHDKEDKKFYFGEQTTNTEYRQCYTIHSENGLNVSYKQMNFTISMNLPKIDDDRQGGVVSLTTNNSWLIHEPKLVGDPYLVFDTAHTSSYKQLELGLSNSPTFSSLLSFLPNFKGKTYNYPLGTSIAFSATVEICDENNYWHVLLPNNESTNPLTFDFSFQII